MPQLGARHALVAIGLVLLVLAASLAVRQPPERFPDEAQHLGYAAQLAEGRGFADFRREPPGTERHQPPAYYLLAALVVRLGGGLAAVRLLSVLAALGTGWLTWRLAREWLPEADPWVPVAAASAAAFLPMNFYLSAAVNNDPAAILTVTWGLLLLLLGLKRGFTPGRALGLGLVCGLALMVKSTSLCLGAAAVVGLGPRRGEGAAGARLLGALVLGGALVAGPWLVRNTLLYGDPLAAGAFLANASQVGATPQMVAGGNAVLYWLQYVGDMAWLTFWGAFDGLQGKACAYPVEVYLALSLWPLGAALGWVRRGPEPASEPWRRRFHWALLAGFAVLLAGFISFNLQLFQAQARYFFAWLPPLMILIAWGLARLGGGSKWLPLGFAMCLFLATLWGLAGPMWAGGR